MRGEEERETRAVDETREEIDAWAQENVQGYRELAPAERREIRATVRQGRALGISDVDLVAIANVSARSGVRISFSKERAVIGRSSAGKLTYTDGFYDPAANEIVINPEGKRSTGRLLFHELSHALYGDKRYRKLLKKAVRDMDADQAKGILARYREAGRTSPLALAEELVVHHAEDVLGNRANLERLVRAEPTIGDKILSFFGLARTEYAGTPRLSRAAGRLYRHFEAALDAFGQENRANLAAEPLTSINPENTQVSVDGRRDAFRASSTGMANDTLLPYDAELTGLIQQRGDYIVDSFDKLVEVVNLAFDAPQKKATVYFGIVTPEILSHITESIPNMPKDFEGRLFKEGRTYSIAATLDSIRHIVDEKKLSREDVIDYLDRFADTILEFDRVTFDYYTDSRGKKTSGLLFRKRFEDSTIISFDLVSNNKRSILLQSLYMENADYQRKKRSAETPLMQNAPANAQDEVGQTSYNPKISQKGFRCQ